GRCTSAYLNDVITYGPYYLDKEELERCVNKTLKGYHRYLATNYVIGFRGREFWNYHRSRLAELAFPLTRFQLLAAGAAAAFEALLNPGQAIGKLRCRLVSEIDGTRLTGHQRT
ncbi:MAG TPA: hypothetical protein VNO32_65810, partial [Candidatus Acidoferrum sp.]|nr:hypothetical protein [Candidatus Acidoferrum sp.]